MHIVDEKNCCREPRQKAGLFIFDREISLSNASDILIGVDEAGRGPLAGPVVACAAWIPEIARDSLFEINDSKKLSEKNREYLFKKMNSYGVKWACAWALPETIDKLNILNATFLAMKIACERLILRLNITDSSIVLVDGPHKIKNFDKIRQISIIDGDAKSQSIAAASIFAKTIRDRWMNLIDSEYPLYGFSAHKGYGTKKHMESLRTFGPCRWHRKTFSPVRKLCDL